MNKYRITTTQPAEIIVHGNNIEKTTKYTIIVDGVFMRLTHEITKIGILKDEIEEIPYILYFENGEKNIFVGKDLIFDPEDPYHLTHADGVLTSSIRVVRVEALAQLNASNKFKKSQGEELSEAKKRRQESNTPVQSKYVRHFFRPFEIDVFLDKLYQYALWKEMWTEAANINFIKNDERLKFSRRIVEAINTIREYDVILGILNDIVTDRKRFPIDEFWQRFHQMM